MNRENAKREKVTRRGFLCGAAALGALSLGGVSGIGSPFEAYANEEIEKNPWELDSVTFEASGSDPIDPLPAPSKWDDEADFVVVGMGGGGLAATLQAALDGATVIAIEKAPHIGGSTEWSTAFAINGGSKVQYEAGIPFDLDATVEMFTAGAHNSANMEMVRTLAAEGPNFVDWMGDLGVPWEIEPVLGGAVCWKGSTADGFIPRATKLVCDFAYEKAFEAGASFLFNSPVSGLVKDGDRVVGVRISPSNETEQYIKANKAVVLTAGGMMNNKDMLRKYCPTVVNSGLASMANTTDTGEIIRMGIGAGAEIAGWDSYFAFDGATEWKSWSHFLYSGDVQLIRQPWLGVTIDGNRYPYFEDKHSGLGVLGLFFQAQVLQALPGHRGYLVFDSNYEENAPKFEQVFCRKLITPDMTNVERMPDSIGPHDWRDGGKAAIDQGIIKQADSIEDLEQIMGFSKGVLVKAVEDWNAICEAGIDEELGFPEEWLVPILDPPFYSAVVGSYPMGTSCGLRVDTKMQVLDKKGVPIPGLYAGGMTAGGTNGESTYGLGCSPLGSNMLSWVMGYLAVRNELSSSN